jgi:hypothetical protein
MLGRDDHGFVDINAIAAISGSILALPDACLVMMMAGSLALRGRHHH